jgi:hypothetical protein
VIAGAKTAQIKKSSLEIKESSMEQAYDAPQLKKNPSF